jgi:lipase chaperone LimK
MRAMRHPALPYLAAAACVALLGLASLLLQPEPQPVAAETASRQAETARFGPGTWTEPSTAAGPQAPFAADTMAPGGLAVTSDQKLVINRALRDVIDYFLFGGHPGERAAHVASLDAHLKAALPPPAYGEAMTIVKNYLSYIEAHDQLLARESRSATPADSALAPMDLDRIAAWVAQRTRLRQNFLGLKVTEIWFGAEQAETETDLAAMRKRGAGAPDAITVDTDPVQQASSALDTMRAKGAPQEAQRQYVAARFGEDAARRFDADAREEQAWQSRYADYRQSADRIRRQAGIDPAERDRQIEALQGKTFAAEPERLRARALDRR